MSSSTPEPTSEQATDQQPGRQLDPDQRAAADPLGVASDLDAGEDDPDAGATAALPGHGVDEVVDASPADPSLS